MTAITAFTYTQLTNKKLEDGRKFSTFTIAAGNGSLTYPTGGIPLSAGSLGLPIGQIDAFEVLDSAGDGYTYEWIKSSNKVMLLVSGATGAVESEAASSVTPTVALTVRVCGY